jgi:hypothetical protein
MNGSLKDIGILPLNHSTDEIQNLLDLTPKNLSKPFILPLETEIHDQNQHIA